jgi:hypothetical protein
LMLHNWTFFIVEDRKKNTVYSRESLKFHGCSARVLYQREFTQRQSVEILSQHERDCRPVWAKAKIFSNNVSLRGEEVNSKKKCAKQTSYNNLSSNTVSCFYFVLEIFKSESIVK